MENNSLSQPALSGLSLDEMTQLLSKLNLPQFKIKQIHTWIYAKFATNFDQMTDLSVDLRALLAKNFKINYLTLASEQLSSDGTKKYLFQLPQDNKFVESVLMSFDSRDELSVCVSSQVGCAVGCQFCATAKLNFQRNLTSQEIIDQIMYIQRANNVKIGNVVYMGQGEPLLNFDEVVKSIKLLSSTVGIGFRHITLSTSGIIPGIIKLSNEKLPITLALSLHACDDELRHKLMPGVIKYSVNDTIKAICDYYSKTKRRVTIEYVLIDGINDTIDQAHKLANIIKKFNCHVNLIPYNPIPNSEQLNFRRPSITNQIKFKEIVEASGKKVTIRLERGKDINAACGQLHNDYLKI